MDPSRMEVSGMMGIMFPQVCPNPAGEETPQPAGDGEQQQRKQRRPALNSSAFWHMAGGVTGNEAYEMIKECSEAKQAKAKATLDKKAERAANKEARKRADNELGSGVWSDLCTLEREVDSLRVDEMRACLMHRAVPIPKGALKPALRALVATAIDSYVGPEDDGELASHVSESSSDAVQFENEQYSDASSLGDDSPYESSDAS